MAVANEAEYILDSIKSRKGELEEDTNWSKPAAIHSKIISAEVVKWVYYSNSALFITCVTKKASTIQPSGYYCVLFY